MPLRSLSKKKDTQKILNGWLSYGIKLNSFCICFFWFNFERFEAKLWTCLFFLTNSWFFSGFKNVFLIFKIKIFFINQGLWFLPMYCTFACKSSQKPKKNTQGKNFYLKRWQFLNFSFFSRKNSKKIFRSKIFWKFEEKYLSLFHIKENLNIMLQH